MQDLTERRESTDADAEQPRNLASMPVDNKEQQVTGLGRSTLRHMCSPVTREVTPHRSLLV